MKRQRRLSISRSAVLALLLLLLLSIGTVGYMLLAGVSPVDALYMTVITISTVGYREVADLSIAGKVFTIFIILGGLGTVSYAVLQMASFFIEGGMKQIFRRRAMKNRIAELRDHIIVCGAGQTGISVVEKFRVARTPFVLIEQDPERCSELDDGETLLISGDATHEEVLEEAGIMHARGLICCLESDVDNVYTVLTARGLNPDLHIVSRAVEKGAAGKLKRAGADKTISPNELGGARMAYMMLRPNVVTFLDTITRFDDEALNLEEVVIEAGSQIGDQLIRDAKLPEKTGLIVIALRKPDGELHFNPGSRERLEVGGSVLVLGKTSQVNILHRIAAAGTLEH